MALSSWKGTVGADGDSSVGEGVTASASGPEEDSGLWPYGAVLAKTQKAPGPWTLMFPDGRLAFL